MLLFKTTIFKTGFEDCCFENGLVFKTDDVEQGGGQKTVLGLTSFDG